MRDHDLLQRFKTEEMNETDNRMSVEECVNRIMLAADKRARKVYKKNDLWEYNDYYIFKDCKYDLFCYFLN